jgi:hypothetical protein
VERLGQKKTILRGDIKFREKMALCSSSDEEHRTHTRRGISVSNVPTIPCNLAIQRRKFLILYNSNLKMEEAYFSI